MAGIWRLWAVMPCIPSFNRSPPVADLRLSALSLAARCAPHPLPIVTCTLGTPE